MEASAGHYQGEAAIIEETRHSSHQIRETAKARRIALSRQAEIGGGVRALVCAGDWGGGVLACVRDECPSARLAANK